ncbi:MAG: biotin--[acetyl-CoA-carboxylase] ligase [Deltaproteobacteria bacterium]|nr:biotin--[acetyl-CoA-carboxylase] ligase [Deltaproteobacteria bacterium]
MEPEFEIISLLKKKAGGHISGEALSARLGISRTAVWKYIASLRKAGYDIEGRSNKGYTLLSPESSPFNPHEIKSYITTEIIGKYLHFFPSIDSTNSKALELARKNAPEGTVVVADAQEKGRGRVGRTWLSPAEANIYTSIILRPDITPQSALALTLMAAVAVAESVAAFIPRRVCVKWPNDVLIDGRKVAGILTEMSSEVDRVNFVVVGIGVNVNMDMKKTPAAIRGSATSVMEKKGVETSRAALVGALYSNIEKWYKRFMEEGPPPVISAWRKFFNGEGKPVKVKGVAGLTGICLGIDDSGALLVRTGAGVIEKVISGDVE